MYNRVNLEIDCKQIAKNFANIKQYVKPAMVMPVLKANAYGLGVRKIATLLTKIGADAIGVASLDEALELQDLNLPIQILGNLLPHEVEMAIQVNLILPINSLSDAEKFNKEAKKQGKIIEVALTIDSGMGRLGMLANDSFDEILKIDKLENLKIIGIYSHFSSAYNKADLYTNFQIETFKKLYDKLIDNGFKFKYVHIGASDAINNFPEIAKAPFNMVRTGINLYGYADDNIPDIAMKLKGVVEFKTYLTAVRELPENSYIGYGRMHKLNKKAIVGTISAGYADGLPLALSNRGYVLIKGVLCPILGRISMDYTTVLLDNVINPQVGDEVICVGKQDNYELTLEEWARLKTTHIYELLCSIGNRVNRKYINQEFSKDEI